MMKNKIVIMIMLLLSCFGIYVLYRLDYKLECMIAMPLICYFIYRLFSKEKK